jgi:hypothetical protein
MGPGLGAAEAAAVAEADGLGTAEGAAVAGAFCAGRADVDRNETFAVVAAGDHLPFAFTSVVFSGTQEPSEAFARVGTGVSTCVSVPCARR